VVEAILQHDKDIISIVATGSGKTLTFWMPLLFRLYGIQIIITPLNILGKQNVDAHAALGIKGIALIVEVGISKQ
jgi:superfamily II DNA helicase RecQ